MPLHIGVVQEDHAKFSAAVFEAAIAAAKPEFVLAKHPPNPDDLVITGPTLANVNEIRAILIL